MTWINDLVISPLIKLQIKLIHDTKIELYKKCKLKWLIQLLWLELLWSVEGLIIITPTLHRLIRVIISVVTNESVFDILEIQFPKFSLPSRKFLNDYGENLKIDVKKVYILLMISEPYTSEIWLTTNTEILLLLRCKLRI